MYSKRLLVLLAILGISGTSSLAVAEDRTVDQIARKPSAALGSHTENVVFEYSARKVLGYVSEARVALDNKENSIANAYIDSALAEIGNISNTRKYLEMMGVGFGRVLYGQNSSYYIPIADDTYAVRTYTNGPFWSNDKTVAVRDVELITVDIVIKPEKARESLQNAKKKIAAADRNGANIELKNLLDESIHETKSENQPFIKLQDNIYLTRILVRQQNYEGARYTLSHAKSALNDYNKTATSADLRNDINKLSKEIDELDSKIKDRNPMIIKQSANMVDKWWNDIKAWVKKKG